MQTTLLESRAHTPRRRLATLSSIAGHMVLLLALAMTRADGNSSTFDGPRETNVVYFPPTSRHAAPARNITPTFTTPGMHYSIPQIDVAPIPLAQNILDFASGAAIAPNTLAFTTGSISSAPTALADSGVLTSLTVDVPVEVIAGQRPPRYPLALERAGVAGDVVAQFVVDTAGRVEPGSITIVHTSHSEFANAVRERLGALRFVPARARGRLVRQLVEQRFLFEVAR